MVSHMSTGPIDFGEKLWTDLSCLYVCDKIWARELLLLVLSLILAEQVGAEERMCGQVGS